jgi:hypothetical protein
MITNTPFAIAHHPVQDTGDLAHPDLQAALFLDLPLDRFLRGLAELDQAAGQTPLAVRGRLAATDEQHASAVQHDRADPDAGDARVLPPVAHAGVASQAGLA